MLLLVISLMAGISVQALAEAESVTEEVSEIVADAATEVTDNVIAFYRDHQEICDMALAYYQDYEDNLSTYVLRPTTVTKEEFSDKIGALSVLLMTANLIERGVLLKTLSGELGEPIPTFRVGDVTCNVCNLDGITIIHANPGKTGEEYTRKAINQICNLTTPDYIYLVGICYGMNMEKYTIGSVFISDNLKTFRLNFRDTDISDEIRFEVEQEYEAHPDAAMCQRVRDTLMYTKVYNELLEG